MSKQKSEFHTAKGTLVIIGLQQANNFIMSVAVKNL
jgi:hypothetical protein